MIIAIVALIAIVSFRLGFLGGQSNGPGGLILNGSSAGWPDRPDDAEDQRLSRSPEAPTGIGSFGFIAKQDDKKTPVTYDPCAPIHIVVNQRTAVPEATRLVDEAIQRVQEASGLVFVVDGDTDEVPSKQRDAQIDRYGDGWAPVLLAWSDPEETPDLEGNTAGYGGSRGAARDDHLWFVSGGLTLDGPQLDDLIDSPNGWDAARAVVMHELGHVVGLNHVDDRAELMQPTGSANRTEWGPGDLEGLAALGSGPCVDY